MQIKHLTENIEEYAFWSTSNIQLHNLKKDVLSQIRNLPICITANDYFTVDSQLLAGVGMVSVKFRKPKVYYDQKWD